MDHDVSPVFDSLDIDLVFKVLKNTLFSPFFVFFVPVFCIFTGSKTTDPSVVWSGLYYVLLCLYYAGTWLSTLYRNQGNLLFSPSRFDWGEQIVVVTGGSSGVGELLANTLAVRNVTVVVLDNEPIITENHNVMYYKCDVSKWEEVEAVSKTIIEEIGHPTVVVNNAGVVQGKLITDLSAQDVQQTFGVNVLAHFWTLKAFLPNMIKNNRGHIITMSSVLSFVGVAQMTDYCASKAALTSLNESLRYELDHLHKAPSVRTTLVCPGHLLTPLFAKMNYPRSGWYQFFMPSVAPVDVVKQLIQTLDDQHSKTIMLPLYTHFVPYRQHFPSYLKDFTQWVAGSDYLMKGFQKSTGQQSEKAT
ncbi:retinal short-chain dehydrogenase reductase [Rhodocollybia butyracea]|uniref:Short-chain dehydrogenase/reductase 3 n=1 Tax=Rhodocollybia butyracea TaxID=206335 RepID=A0A9P5QAU6_9AGAR|nr:retinal short-chain dehydrogenase reductase [Rhodocollybia butyracea]